MAINSKKLVCNTRKYADLKMGVDYASMETGRFVKNQFNQVSQVDTGNLVGIKVPNCPVRYYKLTNFITQ